MLVLLIGVVFLDRGTSWSQVAAVALIVAGILLVRGLGRADARGVAFGLSIAACIAAYTLIDKHGITHAGPITYLELSMLGPTAVYTAAILRTKGTAAVRAAVAPSTIAAGIATFVAYALVLAALQRASAASVAAVRESSVVIATLLAGPGVQRVVARPDRRCPARRVRDCPARTGVDWATGRVTGRSPEGNISGRPKSRRC